MPAWITSELRELVWLPISRSASSTTTSRPASASARATASPTTPAPTTTHSTRSKPSSVAAARHQEPIRPEAATGAGDGWQTRVKKAPAPAEMIGPGGAPATANGVW